MSVSMSVASLLAYLHSFQETGNYSNLLLTAERLLKMDPNNAEYILYKLQALEGLGKVTSDLALIQHYVNMRSTDETGFLLLYKAYMEKDNLAEAALSLAYAISIAPEDEECKSLLNNLLLEVDPACKSIKLNILSTARIGHLSCELEPKLREQQNNEIDCLTIYIADGQPSANDALFGLLKNNANVIESPFWYRLYVSRPLLLSESHFARFPYDINSVIRGVSAKEVNASGIKNLIDIYNEHSMVLDISERDIELGWSLLKKYNLSQGDKVVCLHLRDSQYLDSKLPENDWSYHDYRDADIQTYKDAVLWLIENGYKVVRIGNGTNQTLDINSSAYFDFCSNRDSEYGDFIELVLLRICEFFLATTSGPLGVAAIFDKPTLVLNAAPFEPPYLKYARFIPKRLFRDDKEISLLDVSAGKPLSATNNKEIMYALNSKELVENGYRYEANTHDDILNAVKEFSSSVDNGKLQTKPSTQQQAYWDSLPESFPLKNSRAYVCDSFLAAYPDSFKLSEDFLAQDSTLSNGSVNEWLGNNKV